MSAERIFFDAVTADSDVAALAGSAIYPDVAPQSAVPPLVVYERRGSVATETIHGGPPIAVAVTISASAWAGSRLAAEELGDALVVALADVSSLLNRFAHYDAEKQSYASVLDFEIYEL